MSQKTKKMKFFEDKFYNLDLKYKKGETYDVPVEMVDRWLRRGGVLVEDLKPEAKAQSNESLVSDNKKSDDKPVASDKKKKN